jgi:hypothetical protein
VAVRQRALRFGTLGVVTVLALAGGVAWTLSPRRGAREMAGREREALATLRELLAAETAFQAGAKLDRDRDGVAEFGDLEDLARAGLSVRTPVRDAAGPWLDVAGYRVEVLLPALLERSGRVLLVRSGAGADPVLAARQFAAVATPRADVPSGLRALYLDSAGRLWEAEGVCEGTRDAFHGPPTHALAEEEEIPREGGAVWRLREDPSRRPKAPK